MAASKGLLTKIITMTAIRWTPTFWMMGQSFQRLYRPFEDIPSPKILCLRYLYIKCKQYIYSWLLLLQPARPNIQTCDMKHGDDTPRRRTVFPRSQVSPDPELFVLIRMLLYIFRYVIFHCQLSFKCYFILKYISLLNDTFFGLINDRWCERLM
jgi:hypothetical protein